MRRSLLVLAVPLAVMLVGVMLLTVADSTIGGWLAGAAFIAFGVIAFAKSLGLSMFTSGGDDFDAG